MTEATSLNERDRRLVAWGPIYGLARACETKLPGNARIVLVDPRDGLGNSAAYGLQGASVDVFDLSAFAYAMYPRMTVAGAGPRTLDPATLGVSHIAIWRDPRFMSAALLTEVSATEGSLRADNRWSEVCRFEGDRGSGGSMFRLAATTPPAEAAIEEDVRPELNAALRVIAALALMWAIGAALAWVIAGGALRPTLLLGVSLPLGGLAVAVEMIILSFLGTPWSVAALTVPWLALVPVVWWTDRRRRRRDRKREDPPALHPALSMKEWIPLLLLVLLGLGLVALAPLGLPYSDGLQFYYFRAKAFFTDASILPYYARVSELVFTIPAHPPLVPLELAWLYTVMGRVDEHATLLLWPAVFMSMLSGFYCFCRERVSRPVALWTTLALALVGYRLTDTALRGSFADLFVAVHALLGVGLLATIAARERRSLALAFLGGLLLGGAMIAKEEGVVIAVSGVALMLPAVLWTRRASRPRGRWTEVALAATGVAVAAVPLALLRWNYPVPELLINGTWALSELAQRGAIVVFGLTLRGIGTWFPLIALVLAAILIASRRGSGLRVRWTFPAFVVAVTIVQLAADSAGMALNPIEVHSEVSWTAGRLIAQVLPLPFLAASELWTVLFDRRVVPVGRPRT